MMGFSKAQWDNYRICSVMARIYLAIIIILFTLVKDASYTGWDYLPLEFYLLAGLPLVGIILLTIYFNLAPAGMLKNIFRVVAVVVLMSGIGTQILLMTIIFTPSGLFPLNLAFGLVLGAFIFCTGYTVVGVIQGKI